MKSHFNPVITNEIPVNNGPVIYSGLAGLILKIKDGTYTLLVTKVDQVENEVKIRIQKGGKKIIF